jgi:NAD(P)H-flavin reductase/hemoglobin-like flavoprotein
MGLRQALDKWRSSDDGGRERRARRAVTDAPVHRHQADPSTGQLRLPRNGARPEPVAPATNGYYVPPKTDTTNGAGLNGTNGVHASPRPLPHPPRADLAGAPRPDLDEAPTAQFFAPGPAAGGLVVGAAELRSAPVPVPGFYTPPNPPALTPVVAKPYDRAVVRAAWDSVSDRADLLVRTFYAELFFALGDEAFRMFPSNMSTQRDDFGRALLQWVVADDPESMAAHLDQLGVDHRKFDVEPRHYDLAGQALVNAFRTIMGSAWTAETEEAIVGSYTRLASIMIDGALRKANEPAYWGATVVSHERVQRDFAVLRIQPDAPYLFRAGQYLTLETERQRRQWRQMSIASAPRPDNTFDIHVRAVNATGVSGALVMHTKVGDRLRLGPPRGNDLVVEPGTLTGGVLCLCSGTGAAPISAVVESVLGWRDCPPLYAFVGGRTPDDLYPVEHLKQMVRASGKGERVRIYGVVSDDPTYVGYRGRVDQVVPTLLDWGQLGLDVLVAGPNSMIESAVTRLTERGVAPTKIHFDQYESTA